MRKFLKDNPGVVDEIEHKVKVSYMLITGEDEFAQGDTVEPQCRGAAGGRRPQEELTARCKA